ncbi:hypothetical protein PG997_013127 [Apiospora hydei]|uniref:WSC domain-containing protein n=1 Tax=Apiospora hydei TaxID=1337664 RepID=A0ABR1V7Y5_9PEZI
MWLLYSVTSILFFLGVCADPTWPSSIDELEEIMYQVGLDASLQFETMNAEDTGPGFNTSLSFYSTFYTSQSSMSDLIALGVYYSVRSCGGPAIPIRGGRIDATTAGPDGFVPQPQDGIGTFKNRFSRLGFNSAQMIQLVACGHTIGGVHSPEFNDIVPPGTPKNEMAFDSTVAVFDNNVVTEYLNNNGTNPLVVGNAVALRKNSDAVVFGADKNQTVQALTNPAAFHLTLTYKNRYGGTDCGPANCSSTVTGSGVTKGFDDTFFWFPVKTTIPTATGISSFTLALNLANGTILSFDNNGNSYAITDGIMLQSPQSCLLTTSGQLTVTAAVRNDLGSMPVTLQVTNQIPTVYPVASLVANSVSMTQGDCVGLYTFYTASYNITGGMAGTAKIDVTSGSGSTAIADTFNNGFELGANCRPFFKPASSACATPGSSAPPVASPSSSVSSSSHELDELLEFHELQYSSIQSIHVVWHEYTATPTQKQQVGTYSLVGCYKEATDGRRALSGQSMAVDTMTAEICAAFCSAYHYFGTEYGRECYCGNVLDSSSKPAVMTDCSMSCAGDKSTYCGAGNRLDVYFSNATTGPTQPPTVGKYNWYGCQTEGTNSRALNALQNANNNMTLESCANFCDGFTYFGTEYSRECYCGNNFTEVAGQPFKDIRVTAEVSSDVDKELATVRLITTEQHTLPYALHNGAYSEAADILFRMDDEGSVEEHATPSPSPPQEDLRTVTEKVNISTADTHANGRFGPGNNAYMTWDCPIQRYRDLGSPRRPVLAARQGKMKKLITKFIGIGGPRPMDNLDGNNPNIASPSTSRSVQETADSPAPKRPRLEQSNNQKNDENKEHHPVLYSGFALRDDTPGTAESQKTVPRGNLSPNAIQPYVAEYQNVESLIHPPSPELNERLRKIGKHQSRQSKEVIDLASDDGGSEEPVDLVQTRKQPHVTIAADELATRFAGRKRTLNDHGQGEAARRTILATNNFNGKRHRSSSVDELAGDSPIAKFRKTKRTALSSPSRESQRGHITPIKFGASASQAARKLPAKNKTAEAVKHAKQIITSLGLKITRAVSGDFAYPSPTDDMYLPCVLRVHEISHMLHPTDSDGNILDQVAYLTVNLAKVKQVRFPQGKTHSIISIVRAADPGQSASAKLHLDLGSTKDVQSFMKWVEMPRESPFPVTLTGVEDERLQKEMDNLRSKAHTGYVIRDVDVERPKLPDDLRLAEHKQEKRWQQQQQKSTALQTLTSHDPLRAKPRIKDDMHPLCPSSTRAKRKPRSPSPPPPDLWTEKNPDFIVVPINEFSHWYIAIIYNAPKLDTTACKPPAVDSSNAHTNIPASDRDHVADVQGTEHVVKPLGNTAGEVADGIGHMSLESAGSDAILSTNGPLNVSSDAKGLDEGKEESGESLPVSGTEPKKSAKKASIGGKKHDPNEPKIITLDSLGSGHSPACRNLKDYLIKELRDKKGAEMPDPGSLTMTAKGIPTQSNYCDCGLYLLGYVVQFLRDPDSFIRTLLLHEKIEWSIDAPALRNDIRTLLFKLQNEQIVRENERIKAKREAARIKRNRQSRPPSNERISETPASAPMAPIEANSSFKSPVRSDIESSPMKTPSPVMLARESVEGPEIASAATAAPNEADVTLLDEDDPKTPDRLVASPKDSDRSSSATTESEIETPRAMPSNDGTKGGSLREAIRSPAEDDTAESEVERTMLAPLPETPARSPTEELRVLGGNDLPAEDIDSTPAHLAVEIPSRPRFEELQQARQKQKTAMRSAHKRPKETPRESQYFPERERIGGLLQGERVVSATPMPKKKKIPEIVHVEDSD